MKTGENLVGKTFGYLTVVSGAEAYISPRGQRVRQWSCSCKCGKLVDTRTDSLRYGRTTSCGCAREERRGITHGLSLTPAYGSWAAMLRRCYNPGHNSYKYYGGRGIKVCNRWRKSFKDFFEDMGERPEGKTLDRWPDKNGDYKKSNCRWATLKEQQQNRRRT